MPATAPADTEATLASLLKQLMDQLQRPGAGTEESGIQHNQCTIRVLEVLKQVLQHSTTQARARDRGLGLVIRLTSVATTRFAAVYTGQEGQGGSALIVDVLLCLLQVVPCLQASELLQDIVGAASSLLGLLCTHHLPLYHKLLLGFQLLLQDLHCVLRVAHEWALVPDCQELWPVHISTSQWCTTDDLSNDKILLGDTTARAPQAPQPSKTQMPANGNADGQTDQQATERMDGHSIEQLNGQLRMRNAAEALLLTEFVLRVLALRYRTVSLLPCHGLQSDTFAVACDLCCCGELGVEEAALVILQCWMQSLPCLDLHLQQLQCIAGVLQASAHSAAQRMETDRSPRTVATLQSSAALHATYEAGAAVKARVEPGQPGSVNGADDCAWQGHVAAWYAVCEQLLLQLEQPRGRNEDSAGRMVCFAAAQHMADCLTQGIVALCQACCNKKIGADAAAAGGAKQSVGPKVQRRQQQPALVVEGATQDHGQLLQLLSLLTRSVRLAGDAVGFRGVLQVFFHVRGLFCSAPPVSSAWVTAAMQASMCARIDGLEKHADVLRDRITAAGHFPHLVFALNEAYGGRGSSTDRACVPDRPEDGTAAAAKRRKLDTATNTNLIVSAAECCVGQGNEGLWVMKLCDVVLELVPHRPAGLTEQEALQQALALVSGIGACRVPALGALAVGLVCEWLSVWLDKAKGGARSAICNAAVMGLLSTTCLQRSANGLFHSYPAAALLSKMCCRVWQQGDRLLEPCSQPLAQPTVQSLLVNNTATHQRHLHLYAATAVMLFVASFCPSQGADLYIQQVEKGLCGCIDKAEPDIQCVLLVMLPCISQMLSMAYGGGMDSVMSQNDSMGAQIAVKLTGKCSHLKGRQQANLVKAILHCLQAFQIAATQSLPLSTLLMQCLHSLQQGYSDIHSTSPSHPPLPPAGTPLSPSLVPFWTLFADVMQCSTLLTAPLPRASKDETDVPAALDGRGTACQAVSAAHCGAVSAAAYSKELPAGLRIHGADVLEALLQMVMPAALKARVFTHVLQQLPALVGTDNLNYARAASLVGHCLRGLGSEHLLTHTLIALHSSVLANESVLAAMMTAKMPAEASVTLQSHKQTAVLLKDLRAILDAASNTEGRRSALVALSACGGQQDDKTPQLLQLAVLLSKLQDKDFTLSATSAELLQGLAANCNMALPELILNDSKLLEYVGRNAIAKDRLLDDLAELLCMAPQQLVLLIIPHALPRLVADRNAEALAALARAAGRASCHEDADGRKASALLVEEFGYHVIAKRLYIGTDQLAEELEFMDQFDLTGGIQGFLVAQRQATIRQVVKEACHDVLWHWAETRTPVQVYDRLLSVLQQLLRITQGPDEPSTIEQYLTASDLITRSFKEFGDTLMSSAAAVAEQGGSQGRLYDQLTVLRSVALYVRLAGKHVVQFVPQAMVLLGCCVHSSKAVNLQLHALEGWICLIRSLATHAASVLTSLAHQVMVVVLRVMGSDSPAGVVAKALSVVEELVVEHRHLVKDHLSHLPPLPSHCAAQSQAARELKKAREGLDNAQRLQLLIQLLKHDSLDVRCSALQELRSWLTAKREWVSAEAVAACTQSSELSKQNKRNLLCSLVSALLRCCDQVVSRTPLALHAQQLCAECLGLIGALDPARLQLDYDSPRPMAPTDQALLLEIMQQHLLRMLWAATDLGMLDCAMLAVQQLLKIGDHLDAEQLPTHVMWEGVIPEPHNGRTLVLYNALPADLQATVKPYLASQYTVHSPSNVALPSGVIWGTTNNQEFRSWLQLWTKRLVNQHCSGARRAVFQSCMLAMRRDLSLTLFLLPYIVLNAVEQQQVSDTALSSVSAELRAVLAPNSNVSNKESCVATQAVLYLLTLLHSWRNQSLAATAAQRKSLGSKTPASLSPTIDLTGEWDGVEKLLDSIPQDEIAAAALRVGASARALMMYESYVREAEGGTLNPTAYNSVLYSDGHVAFLQEVYSKLEEPDGLAGISMLRASGPMLQDGLIAAEKAGKWSEALVIHQQLQHQSLQTLRALQAAVPEPLQAPEGAPGPSQKQNAPGSLPAPQLLLATEGVPGPSRKRAAPTSLPALAAQKCNATASAHPDASNSAVQLGTEQRTVADARMKERQRAMATARRDLVAAQRGTLACLLHMGHHQAVMAMVDGVVLRAALHSTSTRRRNTFVSSAITSVSAKGGNDAAVSASKGARSGPGVSGLVGRRSDGAALPSAADVDAGKGIGGEVQSMAQGDAEDEGCWDGHLHQPPASVWVPFGVAACWRLGEWDTLQEYAEVVGKQGPSDQASPAGSASIHSTDHHMDLQGQWEVDLGHLIRCAVQRQPRKLQTLLQRVRIDIMRSLGAASMESYGRAYPDLVKVHMLQELADVAKLQGEDTTTINRIGKLQWASRLKCAQPSLAVQEPLLSMRRQLALSLGDQEEAGTCCLQLSRLCRVTGHYESASSAALQALHMGVPQAALEHAKLLWHGNQTQKAVMEVQQALHALPTQKGLSDRERLQHEAELRLQMAQWTATTGQGSPEGIRDLFEDAIRVQPKWDESYFGYATYLEQVMRDLKQRQQEQGVGRRKDGRVAGRKATKTLPQEDHLDLLPLVLKYYGATLTHSFRHVYPALPRLLTLWFEFGSSISASKMRIEKEVETLSVVQKLMQRLSRDISCATWIVALPQLISRICHPQQEVSSLVKLLIGNTIGLYPEQTFWSLAAVLKSSIPDRRVAAAEITAHAAHASPRIKTLLQTFKSYQEQLIRICYHTPANPKAKTFRFTQDFSAFQRSMPVGLTMPVSSLLSVSMPTMQQPRSGLAPASYDPFGPTVTIEKVEDEAIVMASMQKPKKVTFVGSDGNRYSFLCKPHDDLRKDCRLMEVAAMLNTLFMQDPACRRRGLHLRCFSVIPLTDDCGILEWVPNTNTLRNCVTEVLVAENRFDARTSNNEIKKMYDACKGRKTEWLDAVLAKIPPRLHRWYLDKFPEPASWFTARSNFTRSTAVWCMVGHMLGLGDRHGENILLDSSTGDMVQVDFAMLFDKGLTLQVPEVVPFRLTQNLVDAFGVSGVEGMFTRCCQATLEVTRQHRDTIMSVLETFLHDPLVEWTKAPTGSSRSVDLHSDNSFAKDAMGTIQGRLTGSLLGVFSRPSLPLSVPGQVQQLIAEATSKENLASMYIWWMPWC